MSESSSVVADDQQAIEPPRTPSIHKAYVRPQLATIAHIKFSAGPDSCSSPAKYESEVYM